MNTFQSEQGSGFLLCKYGTVSEAFETLFRKGGHDTTIPIFPSVYSQCAKYITRKSTHHRCFHDFEISVKITLCLRKQLKKHVTMEIPIRKFVISSDVVIILLEIG